MISATTCSWLSPAQVMVISATTRGQVHTVGLLLKLLLNTSSLLVGKRRVVGRVEQGEARHLPHLLPLRKKLRYDALNVGFHSVLSDLPNSLSANNSQSIRTSV